jgi:hypothetical protein
LDDSFDARYWLVIGWMVEARGTWHVVRGAFLAKRIGGNKVKLAVNAISQFRYFAIPPFRNSA